MLEIMVAIFIFALLITTVFGSFRAVFSSTDALGGDVTVFSSARTCLDRMATDLFALKVLDYPRYKKPEFNDPESPFRLVGDTTDLVGDSFGRLRFTSLSHLSINGDVRQGVTRIVYYAHQRSDGTLILRRSDHLYPFSEFEESDNDPVLCDNLLSIEFEYLNVQGDSFDRWDSESGDTEYATPRSVAVKLTLGKPSKPITFTTRIPLYVYRNAAEKP